MVKIPGKDYEMSTTEVTQGLYQSVMGENPSYSKGTNLPVEGVSWYDAIMFCNKLSEKEGLTPVYAVDGKTGTSKWNYTPHKRYGEINGNITQDLNANGYRLPTVEEWMHAARGGQNYKYAGSNNLSEVGWYADNSGYVIHEVGQKKANNYGLYDMSGNVLEWCWDGSRGNRAQCGGHSNAADLFCKVDSRVDDYAGNRSDGLGFRILRSSKKVNEGIEKTSSDNVTKSEKNVTKPVSEGKVLNIYVWNEEFLSRVRDYYPGYDKAKDMIGDVKVNWIITPTNNNAYQMKLDQVLARQNTAKADEKVDIFLVEADYALKYTNSPYAMDVKSGLGFTDADLSKQYQYTKDIMTANGHLKGLAWQACPAGVIYRRSIAKAVLGTDDPDKVQNAISNWAKFDAVAEKAKKKGYFMVSGYDDDYRVFSDNTKTPWVVNGKIKIDDSIREWVKQQKIYTDKGYNNKAGLWSQEQWDGAKKDGKVMCYFGPAWFIDFILAPQAGDSYGDWAFCKGPQGYSWGGTWICAAEGTDNKTLVKDIMAKLTTDDAIMTEIAKVAGDFTNNEKAMQAVANSDYGNPFLGGQNHIRFFLDSAKSINRSSMSPYDQGMNEKFQQAMHEYFNGEVDEATAWENFYTSIGELYPDLVR